jgi:integrase
MPRPTTGRVLEHVGVDGRTYRSLRFVAYGKRRYVSLGPVSAEAAEQALRHTIADVERGSWEPPREAAAPAEHEPIPTFHAFAEDWWLRNEKQLAPSTQLDYRWRLETHLLPFFARHRLDEITFDQVERYIARKLDEAHPLSPRSINMTVTLLGAILEGAVERELIPRNPARGRGRRVRERAPRRSHLETAEQISALLDAAARLDASARKGHQHVERRAMIAVLVFAGLRVGELLTLRWRDVDMAGGWMYVEESKTDAGRRRIKIRGALQAEMARVRERQPESGPDRVVFATSTGRQQSADNFRSRVLKLSVNEANRALTASQSPPLPEGITPHSLRRTFASVLYALGEDPGIVMDEMGHTDPALALRVYRQAMRRGEGERAALLALLEPSDGRSQTSTPKRRARPRT